MELRPISAPMITSYQQKTTLNPSTATASVENLGLAPSNPNAIRVISLVASGASKLRNKARPVNFFRESAKVASSLEELETGIKDVLEKHQTFVASGFDPGRALLSVKRTNKGSQKRPKSSSSNFSSSKKKTATADPDEGEEEEEGMALRTLCPAEYLAAQQATLTDGNIISRNRDQARCFTPEWHVERRKYLANTSFDRIQSAHVTKVRMMKSTANRILGEYNEKMDRAERIADMKRRGLNPRAATSPTLNVRPKTGSSSGALTSRGKPLRPVTTGNTTGNLDRPRNMSISSLGSDAPAWILDLRADLLVQQDEPEETKGSSVCANFGLVRPGDQDYTQQAWLRLAAILSFPRALRDRKERYFPITDENRPMLTDIVHRLTAVYKARKQIRARRQAAKVPL